MSALLEARGLSFAYGGGFSLQGISLGAEAGDCLALAGPNGAGKSTLLKLLAGLLIPSAGSVAVGGEDFARLSARERARRAAWVPQETDALFPVTVEELVRLGFHPWTSRGGWTPPPEAGGTLEKILARFDLEKFRKRDVRTLSGGERRRALLARGLAQGARVLFLDEPTAHLDPRHQAELVRLIGRLREGGVLVVAALHDLSLALEVSNRALLLAEGKSVAEGPTETVLTPSHLERAYGLPAEVSGSGAGSRVKFLLHSGGN